MRENNDGGISDGKRKSFMFISEILPKSPSLSSLRNEHGHFLVTATPYF